MPALLTNVEQKCPPHEGHDDDTNGEGHHSNYDHGNVPKVFGEHEYPQEAGDEDGIPGGIAVANLHSIPAQRLPEQKEWKYIHGAHHGKVIEDCCHKEEDDDEF